MEDLTFGEQVKIILGRKGMTIKELAETIEAKTGKKMSRQNLTQRLGRDNFQEQDMRMIARILECPFQLSIMGTEAAPQVTDSEKSGTYAGEEVYAEEAEVKKAESHPHEAVKTEEPAAEEHSADTGRKEAEIPSDPERAGEAEEPSVHEAEAAEAPEIPEVRETAADVEREQESFTNPEPEEKDNTWTVDPDTGDEQSDDRGWTVSSAEENLPSDTGLAPDERDMTIGELYDIHEELSQLEENAKAGESVEAIKEELEKPKRDWFHGNFFLRRRKKEEKHHEPEHAHEPEQKKEPELYAEKAEPEEPQEKKYQDETDDFEPVIPHRDTEEDRAAGDVNPYTGKEYQTNSVRMHPTRIGYVQVYDRSIHKWTDMTEWAFLGYQERKKALLGSAYEPPIYLD